jgi:uncharacterized repeat protein (TIGR03806 family)
MKKNVSIAMVLFLFAIISCTREEFSQDIQIPDFNFPKTIVFEDSLSAYEVFVGAPSDLVYSEDFELLELTSILFTDYAYKQRLVKIPMGTKMMRLDDGSLEFPNGTILTKTFYYYNDERDTSLGKNIIETRLEIKENDRWNVATYLWNKDQTEALLELEGVDKAVSWIAENGTNYSTMYHVPSENECMTCHQSKSEVIPLGPTLKNLNRNVERDSAVLNQLSHLQAEGLLSAFSIGEVGKMVDYNDLNASIEERGRAYLAMNCAHCHNPNSWERSAEREFDFRHSTPLNQAGILFEEDKIKRALEDGEMPLIGTTLPDQEGIDLVIEYLDSL